MSLTDEQCNIVASIAQRHSFKSHGYVPDMMWLLDLVRELDERASKAESALTEAHLLCSQHVHFDVWKEQEARAERAERECDALKARVAELEKQERKDR